MRLPSKAGGRRYPDSRDADEVGIVGLVNSAWLLPVEFFAFSTVNQHVMGRSRTNPGLNTDRPLQPAFGSFKGPSTKVCQASCRAEFVLFRMGRTRGHHAIPIQLLLCGLIGLIDALQTACGPPENESPDAAAIVLSWFGLKPPEHHRT